MLILTRRVGEAIVIGDNVSVMILGVKGNQIRLGVNAPPNITVDREEVRLRKAAERLENSLHSAHRNDPAR